MSNHPELEQEILDNLKQPETWLRTIKKFGSPVRFYFETGIEYVPFKSAVESITFIAAKLSFKAEKPKYISMAGWGFSNDDTEWK